jgi:uncharacterized protein (TIGR02453 family)
LKENNNRDWFNTNKKRYEDEVREPLLRFVMEFGLRLSDISTHFVADARRTGGSLFRIYRDTRFSADKTPYKIAAGIQFRHESAKDIHAPGFYLHLEPKGSFMGMGLWRPDSKTATKIRNAIVENPEEWQGIVSQADLLNSFEIHGDSLKRPPRGFDPNHPLIEDLKRKDFLIFRKLDQEETCQPEFIDLFAGYCRVGAPFMRFLTTAVGLPF